MTWKKIKTLSIEDTNRARASMGLDKVGLLRSRLTPVGYTTLRYWADPEFSVLFGDDDEAHVQAGYAGLPEVLDLGLLCHVPYFSQYADGYRATQKGMEVLS